MYIDFKNSILICGIALQKTIDIKTFETEQKAPRFTGIDTLFYESKFHNIWHKL